MSQTQVVDVNASRWGVWIPVLLVVAAFVVYLFAPPQPFYLKPLILLAGFALAAAVFFVSPAGKFFVAFAKESWRETKKVVWPSRKEVLQMSGVVFLFVCVMALFVSGIDGVISWGIRKILGM